MLDLGGVRVWKDVGFDKNFGYGYGSIFGIVINEQVRVYK